ncbi:hypothetical protein KFK09_001085 [Dendrobium nobile]|uniref:Glycolipid transfer protein domain-containing protein n=1 Tax=Dendrobium nobile TaxID=94219 RepID=A0A8T3C460_DENNO|nr:hypothetical protein KFK09_001085 [Dendrobium nobile]
MTKPALFCYNNGRREAAGLKLGITATDPRVTKATPLTLQVFILQLIHPSKEEEKRERARQRSNREREREMKKAVEAKRDVFPTEIRLAAEELSVAVKHEEHEPSTLVFLAPSKSLLHILDKIGPTMAVLRQDVQRNIERLEKIYLIDPSLYSSLGEILKKEMDDGTARKRESCSRAILWLTRSLNFSLALLEFLEKESEWSLAQIVEESYKSTLKPWHGWISSAAYKVALKLIPEKEIFSNFLMGDDDDEQDCNSLKDDIQMLVSLLRPLLDEINALLRKFRLDRIKST